MRRIILFLPSFPLSLSPFLFFRCKLQTISNSQSNVKIKLRASDAEARSRARAREVAKWLYLLDDGISFGRTKAADARYGISFFRFSRLPRAFDGAPFEEPGECTAASISEVRAIILGNELK